jgi:predicted permease
MLGSIVARLRSTWSSIRRRSAVEAEINEEFRLHIELRSRDLARSGLSAADALRQARAEFGDAESHRVESRRSLGLHRLDALRFSALDVRLGIRMMVKYPVLTIVAGLGMAVAIAIGTGYTSAMRVLLAVTLPLPDGDRVVALQNWDARTRRRAPGHELDLLTWRENLTTVRDVGAWRTSTRNLVAADGSAEPITIAEMSATGFRVAGRAPSLGRYILDADEAPGAPPVVVIGHDAWKRRFARDSGIVGRELQLGTRRHLVIGVMPEGFAFPINHHYWIPLRASPSPSATDDGPPLSVFGRLASGATLGQARAEIAVIGRRMTVDHRDTHERLEAQVHPYARPAAYMDQEEDVRPARLIPLLTTLLLVVICVNVAVLVYARTAVRHGEIVVRSALGATRQRVIAQLFAESLVLSMTAAVVGLGIAGFALNKANDILATLYGGELPFWMDFGLSLDACLYAVGLAVLAAVITGAVPALRSTGTRLHGSLQQLSAGAGSVRLGRAWTTMIIGQVAVAVALLPVAVYQAAEMFRHGTVDAGFADDEFLSFVVDMEPSSPDTFGARYSARVSELSRRIGAEPGVVGVTHSSSIPGKESHARMAIGPRHISEVPDDTVVDEATLRTTRFALVDAGFLDVFRVPLVAGRGFVTADADSTGSAVIVNQSFVRRHLADGVPLGRRIRHVAAREGYDHPGSVRPERWYEIVGVVRDFPSTMMPEQIEAKVYQPSLAGAMYPATVSVQLRGANVATIGAHMRRVAAALDPALQLRNMRTLAAVYDDDQSGLLLIGWGIATITLSVLLLSAAGIYAMMSLAVTRRRREIGIRAALGANPRHILASVFAGALAQLGAGIGAGLLTVFVVDTVALNGLMSRDPALISVVSTIILAVGLLSSIGPARRGLRIQPAEVLKSE